MDYNLIRSNRKTIAIHIRNEGAEIRTPLKMPKSAIDEFVRSKEKWIETKLNEINERHQQHEQFTLNYGSSVLFCGKEYPVEAAENGHAGFDEVRFYMPPDLNSKQIKAVCIKIYRTLAKRYLIARTHILAEKMDVSPSQIKINNARTRWGSCSGRKNINYSWRIIMADSEVIDYLITHELAHLTEMNHSKRFWAVVAEHCPNYKECEARLKTLQKRLNAEGWNC